MSLVWKNTTGLHRALTSAPDNTFQMNLDADCESYLSALNDALVAQWEQNDGGCCSSRLMLMLSPIIYRFAVLILLATFSHFLLYYIQFLVLFCLHMP